MSHPLYRHVKLAFSNFGVSLGLQAAEVHPERVRGVNAFFESFRDPDNPELDDDAITWVMACTSRFPGLMLPGWHLSAQEQPLR